MKKVITYGSFDLFHEGHYRLLERAKKLGDYLIVGVTTAQYDEQRGKLNVIDSLSERMEHVRATGFADEIIVEDHYGQKIEDIQKYGVDIFTVGSDWIGKFEYIKDFCEVVYLERTSGVSSTMLRGERQKIVQLGIVGSGRIAHRFVPEAKYVSGINVKGVFNPHIDSAVRFKEEFILDYASDDYEDFLNHVDAVVIASPHETHYEYTKRAIELGKHVLCEKPLSFKKSEAEELYKLAEANEVILIEAIKTAYCPGFINLMNLARSGVIGAVRDVEACFSRITPAGLREVSDVKYGGAFTEFGTYTLLPILKLMGTDIKSVDFQSIKDDKGIDLYTKANFRFERGMATSKTGVGVKSEGQLIIAGTKGYILVPSPWWLTKYFEVRYEDPNRIERYTNNFLGDGLRYEISDFLKMINGQTERIYKLTSEESIAMAEIMERFMSLREVGNEQ